LGVSADTATRDIADLRAFADSTWIVNSRNTADADALRALGVLAGFTPQIAHQIDSQTLSKTLSPMAMG
jgi:hypothetical protein